MVDNLEVYQSVKRWFTKLEARNRSPDFNSSATKRSALYWLKIYCRFIKTNPDALIKDRLETLQSTDINTKRKHEEFLESFIINMKMQTKTHKAYAPNSIATATGLVRSFYKSNYGAIQEVRPVASYTVRAFKMPTIKDVKKMCNIADLPTKAWILSQKDSGLANQDLLNLSPDTLSSEFGTIKAQMQKGIVPVHIEIRRQKTGERTHSFFGPNAIEVLEEYMNYRKNRIFDVSIRSVQARIKSLGIKAKVSSRDVPITPYCFRKVFNSYMKLGNPSKDIPGVNESLVELMMGHSIGKVRSAYLVTGRGDTGIGIPISELAKTYMNTYPAIDINNV